MRGWGVRGSEGEGSMMEKGRRADSLKRETEHVKAVYVRYSNHVASMCADDTIKTQLGTFTPICSSFDHTLHMYAYIRRYVCGYECTYISHVAHILHS